MKSGNKQDVLATSKPKTSRIVISCDSELYYRMSVWYMENVKFSGGNNLCVQWLACLAISVSAELLVSMHVFIRAVLRLPHDDV